MENQITDILDKIIPDLGKLITDISFWLKLLLFAGPIVLILMGLYYLFLSPKEANHKAGYRTFFGMGSVNAWKFTQKIAGMAWGGAGIVALIAAIVGLLLVGSRGVTEAVSVVTTILLIQAGAAVLAFLAVEVLVIVCFDVSGRPRRKGKPERQKRQSVQTAPKPIAGESVKNVLTDTETPVGYESFFAMHEVSGQEAEAVEPAEEDSAQPE